MPMKSSPMLEGRRVLVVEDEGMIALMLTELLAGFGCRIVDVAGGLTRGLAAAEFHELDLAVLDVNLGGEKAFRIAHMLTARDVPFVFATGAAPDDLGAAFPDAPMVQKPISPRALEAALIAALGGRDPPPPSGAFGDARQP